MPTIFFSTEDIAGSTIAMNLVYNHGFAEKPELVLGREKFKQWFGPQNIALIELKGHLYEAEYLERTFPSSDLWVFASRHRAESGVPALTVHATGNWGASTDVGGEPRKLGLTSARAIRAGFDFLTKNRLDGYDVTLESTHHGPTGLTTPSVWIELGSTPKQWKDNKAAEVVSQAILHTCQDYERQKGKVALGFGGTHYASKFNKLEGSGYLFSHIAPKHALDGLDAALIREAIGKTSEKVELAVIDWKGCSGEQRERLITAIEAVGLKWEKA